MNAPPPASSGRRVVMLTTDDRIDRRILDQARSLSRHDFPTTVIAGSVNPADQVHDEQSYPDVPIHRLDRFRDTRIPAEFRPAQRSLEYGRWSKLCRHHRRLCHAALAHRADVFVAHDLVTLPAAALAAAHFKSHLVYDAHELFADQPGLSPSQSRLYQRLERTLIHRADLVMTVNKSVARFMAMRYGIPLPAVILNLPRLHGRGIPDDNGDSFRRAFNLAADDFVLLYQGNIRGKRNLENLVQAMALVRNDRVRLVFMGHDDGARMALTRCAQDLRIFGSRVFFHEPVSQNRLLAHTAAADAGIIPYTADDLNTFLVSPNKLYEYIVAGVPVLANDLPELLRFVALEGIGMARSLETPQEIAAAIDAFTGENLGQYRQALESARRRYEWTAQEAPFVSMYEQLIRLRPRSTSESLVQGRAAQARNLLRNGMLRVLRRDR